MTDLVNEIRSRVRTNLSDAAMGTFEVLARDAADHIETLETALRNIQSAVPKYLKKEMTAEEFALVVIGEVDNKAVFRALEGKHQPENGA